MAGYNTPVSISQTLSGSGTITFTGNYIFIPPPPPVLGTVNVSANISAASWTITGPSTRTGSGVSASYPSMPLGVYTITWNSVAGYNTPVSISQTLSGGGIITFSGNYIIILPPPPPPPVGPPGGLIEIIPR